MNNTPDPKTILEQVYSATNTERLTEMVAELQHLKAMAKGEVRRLRAIVENLGDSVPQHMRDDLDLSYDLELRFHEALRVAKINLRYRGHGLMRIGGGVRARTAIG